jgi:hypothetical protein
MLWKYNLTQRRGKSCGDLMTNPTSNRSKYEKKQLREYMKEDQVTHQPPPEEILQKNA